MQETDWEYRLGAGTRILIGVLCGVAVIVIAAAAMCCVGWAYTFYRMS